MIQTNGNYYGYGDIKIGMVLKQDLGISLSNLEKMSICEYLKFNIEEVEVVEENIKHYK